MNRLLPLALAVAITGCTGEATEYRPHTLHVGIDVSGSVALLAKKDEQREDRAFFADLAARKAESIISSMRLGDRVRVQFFGARSLGNLKTLDIQINRQARPQQVASAIGSIIRGIPDAGIDGQAWTQISRHLRVGNFDCAAGDHVLIISDGVESTPDFNEKHLLAGRRDLPAPQPGMLAGCRLSMFGIGVSAGGMMDAAVTDRLIAQWRAFAEAAGAEFEGSALQ